MEEHRTRDAHKISFAWDKPRQENDVKREFRFWNYFGQTGEFMQFFRVRRGKTRSFASGIIYREKISYLSNNVVWTNF